MNQKKSNKSLSVNELAARLAEGDKYAIAEIYKKTYTPLFYFGLQIVGNHQAELVEDVLQELFLWLAKNYQKTALINNLEGYLYQAVRQNLQQKAKAKQDKNAIRQRYLNRTAPNHEKNAPSPQSELLKAEQKLIDKIQLDQEIQTLPTYQKEVLYLRFFEDRSYRDIAEILSINSQVARNYVFKALTTLRKNMKKLPLLSFL